MENEKICIELTKKEQEKYKKDCSEWDDGWESINEITNKMCEKKEHEVTWRDGESMLYDFEEVLKNAGIRTPYAEKDIWTFCLGFLMAKHSFRFEVEK